MFLEYILTGHISSDFIEGRFGWYRQLLGDNYYNSVLQFLQTEKTIRIQSLVKMGLNLSDIQHIFEADNLSDIQHIFEADNLSDIQHIFEADNLSDIRHIFEADNLSDIQHIFEADNLSDIRHIFEADNLSTYNTYLKLTMTLSLQKWRKKYR